MLDNSTDIDDQSYSFWMYYNLADRPLSHLFVGFM